MLMVVEVVVLAMVVLAAVSMGGLTDHQTDHQTTTVNT